MKKVYSFLLTALLCLTAYAQSGQERLVVYDKAGGIHSYLVDHVEKVAFPTIDGEVKVDIQIHSMDADKVIYSLKRSADCDFFYFDSFYSSALEGKSELELIRNMNRWARYALGQDYESQEWNIANDAAGTKFTFVAVACDSLGTPCTLTRVELEVPERPLVGDPKVAYTLDELTPNSATFSFTPNDDATDYAVAIGSKGYMQGVYDAYKDAYDWNSFGDMVVHFRDVEGPDPATHTWSNLFPYSDYQIFIQPIDANGTYAPCDTVNISTPMKGGEGVAEVSITQGEYVPVESAGELRYLQYLTFTLNEEASSCRYNAYLASWYEENAAKIEEEMKSASPEDFNGGTLYGSSFGGFYIDPNTDVVVAAVAQNINGEWGPFATLRFTTPEVSDEGGSAVPTAVPHVLPMAPKLSAPAGKGLELNPRTLLTPKQTLEGAESFNSLGSLRRNTLSAGKAQPVLQLTGK